jgi:hypothetical protein
VRGLSAILSPRGTPARFLLAWQAGAFDLVVVLVSGDAHLTVLAGRFPVRTPAQFLASLGA